MRRFLKRQRCERVGRVATRPSLSQFRRLEIRRLTSFIYIAKVNRRIFLLQSCEKVGRVASTIPTPHFKVLELRNITIDVSKLHKNW